jgi:hypothetical protein
MKILFFADSLSAGDKECSLVELLIILTKRKNLRCKLVVMSDDIYYQEIIDMDVKNHYLIRRIKKGPSGFFKLNKICSTFYCEIIDSWGTMRTMY